MLHPLTVRSLLFDLGWGGGNKPIPGPAVVSSCERDACLGDDLDFEISDATSGSITLDPDRLPPQK